MNKETATDFLFPTAINCTSACQWPKEGQISGMAGVIILILLPNQNKAAGEILQVCFTLLVYHVPFIYLKVRGSIFGNSKIESAGQSLFGLLKYNKMSGHNLFSYFNPCALNNASSTSKKCTEKKSEQIYTTFVVHENIYLNNPQFWPDELSLWTKEPLGSCGLNISVTVSMCDFIPDVMTRTDPTWFS